MPKDHLHGLVSNLALNAINKFERKISCKEAVRVGKGFPLFISNQDMNDIIKIIKSLDDTTVLIDGITKASKHEIKKQEGGFLGALLAPAAASVKQPMVSSVVILKTMLILLIISITSPDLMVFFQEILYLE